jgi:hypothetical protein
MIHDMKNDPIERIFSIDAETLDNSAAVSVTADSFAVSHENFMMTVKILAVATFPSPLDFPIFSVRRLVLALKSMPFSPH